MKKIILSRTDNLGDVILTLPMAGFLKKHLPGCHIIFLGKSYTRPLIERSRFVDAFLDWDELKKNEQKAIDAFRSTGADTIVHVFPVSFISRVAMKAGIKNRIATTGRIYSWFYSNKLVRLTRRRSELHEAQLNIRMLEPLGVPVDIGLNEIPDFYGFTPSHVTRHTSPFTVILHPKSKGSAREWGLENYARLIHLLTPRQYDILVTGTREEGDLMRDFLKQHEDRIKDLTGKLKLSELIDTIDSADALVAASTGPLHIAAALGKVAIGLYAPMRPIFPKRWAPLGKNAVFLCKETECNDCRKSGDCHCIREITPETVVENLTSRLQNDLP
ncbi:MAG: glycosyltransferase family 9 protein [Syntrophothermus sp.]